MQSIQNFFHTDRWWGKTIFIIVTYVLFWCVFYGLIFFIPEHFFETYNIQGYVTLIYALVLIPLLSFFIPPFIKNTIVINKVILYILHIIFVIASIVLFLAMLAFFALQNFQIG